MNGHDILPIPEAALPASPAAMPFNLDTLEPGWFLRAIQGLYQYDVVAVNREREEPSEMGEEQGDWVIYLYDSGKHVTGRHKRLENALWYATTIMEAKMHNMYEEREKRRAEALAKLTSEDKEVLGIWPR